MRKPITQPIVDELGGSKQPKKQANIPPQDPPKPAELDQDPGGGFNNDHTYPQT